MRAIEELHIDRGDAKVIDLNFGDTQLILTKCRARGLLRNQAAYVLATAFWETARTMEPVREAFWLSEDYRKENLRYHPWYGRGYVQLTWETNYERAGRELGCDLTTDPDEALRPDIAADVIVLGMVEGWFTGKKLADYITLQYSDFKNARRIVNGTDRAQEIADLSADYDAALKVAGYGEGKQERTNPAQSTTLQATAGAAVAGAGGVATVLGALSPTAQVIVLVCAAVGLLCLGWIARERLKRWGRGDR